MVPQPRKRQRTSAQGQSTLDQAWETDKLQEVLTAAKSAHHLAEPILATITNAVEKHGNISGWIDSLTKTPEALQFWGRQLHTLFPPQMSRDYLGSQPGGWPDNKLMPVHLWMLSWSEEDGFSLPSNDDMLLMISMVLTAGFLTDPATPGVEALSVRKGKRQESPVLLEFITSVETESGTMNQKRIINEQVGIGSIGYIKGLKRSLAALAIVAAIVVLEILNVHEMWPSLWMSFCTAIVTYSNTDVDEAFLTAVDVTHRRLVVHRACLFLLLCATASHLPCLALLPLRRRCPESDYTSARRPWEGHQRADIAPTCSSG